MSGLDELIHCLANVDRATEASFLELGTKIQGFHKRAHGLSKVAGDVLDLLHGEEGETALQSLQLLVERCSLWLGEADDKSSELCLLLKRVLALIRELEPPVAGLRKVIKTFHSLRVSTRIEAAKGYAIEANVLAKSLDELGALVQAKVTEICNRTEALVPVIERSVSMEESVQAGSVRIAGREVDKARKLINTFLETSLETEHWSGRLRARSVDVAKNFGEMVAALQFQDITRQRIEHVQKALVNLGVHFEKLRQHHDLSKQDEASRLFGCICQLQHNQLSVAVREFVGAADKLVENLQGMAMSAVSMSDDTRGLVSATAVGSENRFVSVVDVLQTIASHLEKTRSTHELAGLNLNKVCTGIQQVTHLVEEVEFIGEEMQLLATNAAICAAHAQTKGAGLDVIAQNIRFMAEEACLHALSLATKCATVTRHARQLQEVEQGNHSSAVKVSSLLQEAQDSLSRMDANCRHLSDYAGRIDCDAADLSEEVSDVVRSLKIGEVFQAELGPVLDKLDVLSKQWVGEKTTVVDNADLEILFDELALCYTMSSERKLHRGFLNNGSGSAATGVTEADPWSEKRQHDFGDNVDLF